MEFKEVIRKRYSCRKYSDKPVEAEAAEPSSKHADRKDLSETVKYL